MRLETWVALAAVTIAVASCALPTGPAERSSDPLGASKACAPSGWTADVFPPGSRDYGFGPNADVGRIRLITPESVASGKGLSKAGGATFITDWWTVSAHEETSIVFADGRVGKQYRSRSGTSRITTEFTTAAGTWQLYSSSDERYDEVLRCVEGRLAGAAR
ncbi:MAG: hypothetical protein HY553_17665 [Elusimicrobia bacterium]|nr:hypothetical protein [Elusimicrobiota bacterium]